MCIAALLRKLNLIAAAAALFLAVLAPNSAAAQKKAKPAPVAARTVPAVALESIQIVWSKAAVRGALDVFPHPVMPRLVTLATEKGLLLSADFGKTFAALAQATAQSMGVVRAVAYDPLRVEDFYAGGEKGIWLTRDSGKTFTQVGSKARGMGSDDVVGLWVYPDDPSSRTLLAAHGAAAAGLSVTYDGGAKWQVLCPNLYVRLVAVGPTLSYQSAPGRSLLLVAAPKDNPDVFRVYSCTALGESPIEQGRDVVPTDLAVALMPEPEESEWHGYLSVYIGTPEADLWRMVVGFAVMPDTLRLQGVTSWASVGVLHGPTADSQLLYGYDPAKLGLVMAPDTLKTVVSSSRGLPTGPFIREGAHLRAGGGLSTFYATVNGGLYVGTVGGPGMRFGNVEVTPPIISISPDTYNKARQQQWQEISMLAGEARAAAAAKHLRQTMQEVRDSFPDCLFTVRARVLANAPPTAVTVDLSAMGGPAEEAMFDDGKHDDGAAGDGVYAAQFRFNIDKQPDGHRRNRWPGVVGLPITVTTAAGELAGAVAVASIHARSGDIVFWDEPRQPGNLAAEGGATAEIIEAGAGIHSGRKALAITVAQGPWSTTIPSEQWFPLPNIMSYEFLTFWVKSDGKLQDEIFVQLRDAPSIGMSEKTRAVPLRSSGYLKGGAFSDDWREVSIPIKRFLSDAGSFQPAMFSTVILSGEGKSPGRYWIDSIRLARTAKAEQPSRGK